MLPLERCNWELGSFWQGQSSLSCRVPCVEGDRPSPSSVFAVLSSKCIGSTYCVLGPEPWLSGTPNGENTLLAKAPLSCQTDEVLLGTRMSVCSCTAMSNSTLSLSGSVPSAGCNCGSGWSWFYEAPVPSITLRALPGPCGAGMSPWHQARVTPPHPPRCGAPACFLRREVYGPWW